MDHFLGFLMNKIQLVLLLSLVTGYFYAELLVVKRDSDGFTSLTKQDVNQYGVAVSKILLKYQWPMCTDQDLTDKEKDELLTADKPYGEERFVEQKLQNVFEKKELDLGVLYVPSTLYELFCLQYFFKDTQNPLYQVVREWLWFDPERGGHAVDLKPILNKDIDPAIINDEIKNAYQRVNERFVSGENALLEVNRAFTSMLFDRYPELGFCQNALEASNFLETKSQELLQALIKDLIALEGNMKFFSREDENEGHKDETIQGMAQSLLLEDNAFIVKKIINSEYEARQQNKALLMRGTSCAQFVGFEESPVQLLLIGSTIRNYQCKKKLDEDGRDSGYDEISLFQAYQEQTVGAYSISFGSTPFAGFINDNSACAYHFLTGKRVYTHLHTKPSESYAKIAGYELFVDKKKYMQNRNDHLFMISPLMSMAGLMSDGEYFHSRTTAATSFKNGKPQRVSGLFCTKIKDPASVILIQRDPLLHAEMFSDFVAKNGRIIQYGDDRNLTDEEKKLAKKVLEDQALAAKKYQEMRAVAPVLIARRNSELSKG